MAMMMFFCCIDFSFIYAEGEQECSNSLNEWYVQATWNNDSTEYNLSSSKKETLYPKLTVRYYINNALREYKAGDVVITVPGIGGIKRGALLEAETAANQANSEWNMSYDSKTDTYTFTNKNSIYLDQTKSGGFEMMWVFESRDGENGYSASGYPTFSLKNGEKTESITLPELKFSYTSERDKYNIEMERSQINSSEFGTVAQGRNDRIWYKYTTTFNPITNARGIYKSDYFIKVNIYDDSNKEQPTDMNYEDIEVYLSNGTRTKLTKIIDPETNEEVYGFYAFENISNVSTNTFYLGMPKTIDDEGTGLDGKTIFVQSSFIALYNDETEYVIQHRDSSEEIKDENLIDDNSGEINDYDFNYSGNNFWHTKESLYDKNHISNKYSNRLLSNELYNSRTISYTLTASTSVNYSSSSTAAASLKAKARAVDLDAVDKSDFDNNTRFQFIQGDDRVAIELEDGSIRNLEDSEYNFAYITIPRESTTHSYTVYTAGSYDTPFNEYRVYKTGKTSQSQSVTIQLDESVKAFYVAIEDVVGSYKNYIYVGVNFHLDWNTEHNKPEAKRINTEGKVINFSYFRMVYQDSDGKEINYASTDGNNYAGSYGLQIKAEDAEIHKEYLYRKSCDIPLRTTVTNISSNTVLPERKDIIQPSGEYGGGYIFNNTTSGTIRADESGELKKFSIYAVMQDKDMQVDENLNDVICSNNQTLKGIKLSGSATTIEGKTINDFSDYVSYEVKSVKIKNTVVTVVAANFDFTNMPLDIGKITRVSMTFPVRVKEEGSYAVNSYTIVHDSGISKVSGDAITADIYDIDADGDVSERIAYSNDNLDINYIVISWEDKADKYVDTYLTEDYVHSSRSDKTIEAFAWDGKSDSDKYKYSYKLSFDVGNKISDAVFYDNIEQGDKDHISQWYGTFLSVDTSELESFGIIPTVYYSSEFDSEQDYTDTGKWKTMTKTGTTWAVPEETDVKSIAIHTDLSKLVNGQISEKQLYAVVNMRTPTVEADGYSKNTYNDFSVKYTAVTPVGCTAMSVKSGFTQVVIVEESPKLIIKKYDKLTNNALNGAKFTIYTEEDGVYTAVSGLENLSVGNTGQLVINKGLKFEQDYYYRETTAPNGYEVDNTYHKFRFEKNEETKTIEVYNTRLTGTAYFTKKDADNAEYSDSEKITSLAGAEYSLYKYDGTQLFVNQSESENGTNIYEYSESGTVSDMITGLNGFKLKNLPWGNYYLVETTAPNGYELNKAKISFAVQRNLAEQNKNEIKITLSQTDIEKTASIALTKTDSQNGNPLKGARFNLERLNSDGEWETVSGKTNIATNVMGELVANDIKFGTYRFKEVNAPIGYQLDDENCYTKTVVLDASTVGKILTLTMQNDRQTGSATMTKYSDDGKTPLAGAKYDLYMVIGQVDGDDNTETDDQRIKYNMTTDVNGKTLTVSGLEWGKYYFVETAAPRGYEKSSEKISFEITAENVDVQVDRSQNDKKILGSVKLTKTAGEAVGSYELGASLEGVEFELYTKAGEQVKATYDSNTKTYSYDPDGESTFITGADGTITVNKLPWDSYYFEETKALDGFALADKVRFTINAGNCNSVQELECENMAAVCLLKIEKEIDTSIKDFGTPTFLFKITKIDVPTTSYTKSLIIKDGTTSGSFTMSVQAGTYKIEEIKVARYKPTNVEIVEAETTTSVYTLNNTNHTAEVTLATTAGGEPDTACVKFTNELYKYDKVSHNSSATNIIAANRKITGISAEYTDGLIPVDKTNPDSTYTIEKDKLRFKILYDDGSEEEITPTDGRYKDFILDSSEKVYNGSAYAGQVFQQNVTYKDSTTNKTYKAQFDVEVAPLKVVESIKVIFKVDADNSCYFLVNGKHTSANVVYYNEDDDENKIAVSGEYIEPTAIEEDKSFYGWEDSDGNLIAVNEEGLKQYLKTTDKTELTLYAKISFKNIVQDFDYTGNVQEFTAPYDGYYKMECWGAGGGNAASSAPGFGAYTSGYIYMKQGETVYIYVGEKGIDGTKYQAGSKDIVGRYAYNGGGAITNNYYDGNNGGGGGATDIRLTDGKWNDFDSLKSRVMVAGGGGGGVAPITACGHAGTLESSTATFGGSVSANGATQTSGYKFGEGETKSNSRAGAGGGYYGGLVAVAGNGGAVGSGGSSFISGYDGCDAISGDSTSTKITHTGRAVHYSGKYFIDGIMRAGNESMPDYNSEGIMSEGNHINGHARITYINPYAGVDFDYTGDVQTFTAPQSGTYMLETWGASGGDGIRGDNIGKGGNGGYSYGTVHLNKGETVYIAIGGRGNDISAFNTSANGGYNGGGNAKSNIDTVWGSGGGATSITTESGLLSSFNDNKSAVLIVAGGGGGGGHCVNISFPHRNNGGFGGGNTGGSSIRQNQSSDLRGRGNGGTQETGGAADASSYGGNISSGSFGQGGNGQSNNTLNQQTGSGGGGGYYGGSSGFDYGYGGGGGSGYVASELISGKTIAGDQQFIAPDGTTETGHQGNGYARITLIK